MKKRLNVLCSLLLALSMLLPTAVIPVFAEGDTEAKYEAPASPAVTYNMNVDWSFRKAEENVLDKDNNPSFSLPTAMKTVEDAEGHNFYEKAYIEDPEKWSKVSVPHAVNAEDSFDELGVDKGESGLYRGFMFYRKNITIPADTQASKFFLEFEAFRQSVYLYVNEQLVGYYEAGVAPAGFDITNYVTPGEEALVAIATDNLGSGGINNDFRWAYGTRETIPGTDAGSQSGITYQWNQKDFNEIQGGLTGNVNLYAKGSIYQTLPLYNNLKTTGNYIYGTNFDLRENSADINVEAEIRNESNSAKDITLEVVVVDSDGQVVDTFTKTENVPDAADKGTVFESMVPDNAYDDQGNGQENNNVDISTVEVKKIKVSKNVSGLKFWSDVSPNLYDVYTILKDGETVIDVDKTTTGFREVTYDKDNGLQINGQTTYLKGYAQRSTNEWAAIGVANDWLTDIDMQLIKESNANFIRWMHIAPNPVDIRGGDKYGVISIVPAGDKEKESDGRGWDQRVEAMRDVIIYFRNSPSAIFWEAGNNQISGAHMREMTELRKALAPDSDTFMGCRTLQTAEQVREAEWVGTMLCRQDSAAYGAMESTGNYVPMLETEYHRNEAPRRVWDDYSPPYYDYVNKFLGANADQEDGFEKWDQTQEDFSRTMFNPTDGYTYFYNNRVGGSGKNYYSGAAMMVWSDSNMHVRNCGVENCRTSGRVDPIRLKKESFYAIQAAQSATPKIHILGHWNYPQYIEGDAENGNYWYYKPVWNGHNFEITAEKIQRGSGDGSKKPTQKTVYVIGSENLKRVELYVNGKKVGEDEKPDDNYIFAFDNIDVTESGTVSAKAYNHQEEVVANDEIKTAGEPATVRLTPVYGPDGKLRADGSDLMYVDIEVVDAEGNVCPTDERKITFKVSDDTKATFIGGYNSGYYGNYDNGLYNAPGGRIANHKDYVYAECGINRVFVQSTREAGDVTLTVSPEGMQPVTVTISSEEFKTEGGLSLVPQQTFEQGEVPAPPAKEKAPILKSLGNEFTADWTEETGNVAHVQEQTKDYYTVLVNGTEVNFKEKAYKPDSNTGVVAELNPILDALDVEYTYHTDGEVPSYIKDFGGLPYIEIGTGANKLEIVNGSTNLFEGGEKGRLMNFEATTNADKSSIFALVSVLGVVDGIEVTTNEEDKTVTVTKASAQPARTAAYAPYLSGSRQTAPLSDNAYPASLVYQKGTVTVKAAEKIENAVLLIAGYDDKGVLKKLTSKPVTVETETAVTETIDEETMELASVKAMLWDGINTMKPLALTVKCEETYKVDDVYEYDTVASLQNCDEALANSTLSTDTSPDGTKYLTQTGESDIDFAGLSGDSMADIMWSADVRFNNDGSSIIPRNNSHNYGTCVVRHGTKLAIQTGGTSFTDYEEIDPTAWYHIVLIGRYSAPDAKTDLIVYKYENGEKVFVARHDNVNQRNLSANNKSGASHWHAGGGISVDNARIVMLGADRLKVESDADTIKAGNVMQMAYSATRQGAYITKPNVAWEIYDEANENKLDETSGLSIDSTGILKASLEADSRVINVRATAQIKEGKAVYASKKITVEAVDISDVKFDTLTLTADKTYVSAADPLTITASATKNGEAVTLANDDLIWYATDKTDMMKLGEDLKWIKIENGVVTVDPKTISQDITIRAADPDDKVRGSLAVHIKSSDALEGNEDGTIDKLLIADNCEAPIATAEFVESIDGTHAYKATAGYQTAAISETINDIVVEMDIRFDGEGAGFQPAKNGKLNTCVVYHDGKLCVQTGQSNYTSYADISSAKWYHITLIRKKGAYAHIVLEEYNADGSLKPVGTYKEVNQRNNEATAFVNINAGTTYDNIRILTPAPTAITIGTDAASVFAGESFHATSAMFWNGLEMKNPDASTFEYKIYDAEDKLPVTDDAKITVNAEGLISVDAMTPAGDYHVRAIAKASGKFASKKFTVNSSDIIEMKQLGVNDDENRLVNLTVDKKFFYDKEMAFVAEVFDKRGAVKAVYTKQMYGDALPMGESAVALGFDLPSDFNKAEDIIKIYAVTRLYTDEVAEPDTSMTVRSGSTDSAPTVNVANIPAIDNGSTVLVMALKANADETDLKAEDILYFKQLKAADIAENNLTIPCAYEAGMTVKLSGNINGVHTVVKAVGQ